MKILKYLVSGLLAFLLSFLVAVLGAEEPETYDLLIKNARIIDGTGAGIYYGDIGIKDETIVRIADNLTGKAPVIFNSQGFTVAPAKVEWPLNEEWVERDLASAVGRYPLERLLIKEAFSSDWIGKSVEEVINKENIALARLTEDRNTKVLIMPLFEMPELNTVEEAFYGLTGWRGEMLEKKAGKIQEGFPANMIVFNHRELTEIELLDYLLSGEMPPVNFFIEGGKVRDPKID